MFLKENKISSNIITKLENYISEEEYETDSIYIDIEEVGNIANQMREEKVIRLIMQLIQTNKSMNVFSFLFFLQLTFGIDLCLF